MTTSQQDNFLDGLVDHRTPFKYEQLNSETKEIRLAVLLEGKESDDIVCRIIHRTLESGIQYEALSYVWGSCEEEYQIQLMDEYGLGCHFFPVTRNLEGALRLLRLETRSRALWIDAICINQKDSLERSAQVTMMRSIYSSSFSTVVYFGPQDEISSKGMELMRLMAGTIYIDRLPEIKPPLYKKVVKDHPVRKLLAELDGVETVHKIYSRPWWSRVWIAQELAVSKNTILQWGKKTLPWECCARTIAAVYNYVCHLQDTPEWKETETWEKILDCSPWTMAITGTSNGFSQNQRPFRDLLERFWLSEATDPRDKVYALLGLATDDHADALVPDYSLPVEQLYGMVVKDLMTRSKNLDILSLCSSTGPRHVDGLATWAPNWRSEGKKSKLVPGYHTFSFLVVNERPWIHASDGSKAKRRQFCASGESGSLETVQFSEDFRVLFLTGLVVGIISKLSEVRSYRFSYEEIKSVWGAMGDSLIQYPTGEAVCVAFLRTLCANQSEIYASGLCVDPIGFMRCIQPVTSGRRFMITDNGCMGLAVAEAKEGDIICIVKGSRVPLILREEDDHFVMVGETYVHGLMYGEAYESSKNEGLEVKFRIM